MEARATAKQFERRLRLRPASRALEITEGGMIAGAGTVLARMNRDRSGAKALAINEDGARIFALLGAAYGQNPPPDLFDHLRSAAAFWKRGDKALANLRLIFACIPRLDGHDAAYRLFLAEHLLDHDDLSPAALMKIVGLEPTTSDLAKFNPDQPRVPAGSGKTSGQWTGSGSAEAARPESASPESRTAQTVTSATMVLPAAGGSRRSLVRRSGKISVSFRSRRLG